MNKQRVLLIDLANMFWLSRPKHTHESSLAGDWPIVQQWLYSLNFWIKIHRPTSIVFLGDGYPKWRYTLYGDYKAGRAELRDKDPLTADFNRQKNDIKKLIQQIMPVYYLYHESLEADDLFYIISRYLNEQKIDIEIIGCSTDDDWRQMMVTYENVKCWQPIKKEFKVRPDYDFVRYKAVLGDHSDNIKGFPKIGKVTALKIASDENRFNEWYASLEKPLQEQYQMNLKLVDSTNIAEDQYEFMGNYLREFEIPKFSSGFLKTYCQSKHIYRFLKNFEEKVDNFRSLKPITFK